MNKEKDSWEVEKVGRNRTEMRMRNQNNIQLWNCERTKFLIRKTLPVLTAFQIRHAYCIQCHGNIKMSSTYSFTRASAYWKERGPTIPIPGYDCWSLFSQIYTRFSSCLRFHMKLWGYSVGFMLSCQWTGSFVRSYYWSRARGMEKRLTGKRSLTCLTSRISS